MNTTIKNPEFVDIDLSQVDPLDYMPFVSVDGIDLPIGDGWYAGRIPEEYFDTDQNFRFVRSTSPGLSDVKLIAIADDLDEQESQEALAMAIGIVMIERAKLRGKPIPRIAVWAADESEVEAPGWPVVRMPLNAWLGSWYNGLWTVKREHEREFEAWQDGFESKLLAQTGRKYLA